jgi:energy-coupling factor transporter ATP-binding protein EcfA2
MPTISLKNFKCWEKHTFSIKNEGVILINGISGKGKTTLLNAILYVITGISKNLSSDTSVTMDIDDILITRTKKPSRVIVKKDNITYEDDIAQSIIDKIFGKEFRNISYIDQDNQNSFVYLSPGDKMNFLRDLLLNEYNIDDMKDKLKNRFELTKKNLLIEDANILTTTNFLKTLCFTDNNMKIDKRIITEKNYNETFDTMKTNLLKCEKNRTIISTKLKQISENTKLFEKRTMLDNYMNELSTFDSINVLKKNLEEFENIQKRFKEIEEFLTKKTEYEKNVKDLVILNERLSEYPNVNCFKIMQKIVMIFENLEDLDDIDETIEKQNNLIKEIELIKISINSYKCPSCDILLCLHEGKLIVNTTQNKLENIDLETQLEMQLEMQLETQLKDKVLLLEKITKEIFQYEFSKNKYNKNVDLIEKYIIDYNEICNSEKLDLSDDFKEKSKILQKKEREFTILKNNISEISKKIQEFEKNSKIIEENTTQSNTIYEIIKNITEIKEKIRRVLDITNKIEKLSKELDGVIFSTENENEIRDKYEEYDNKIKKYSENIQQLEYWSRTNEINKKYIQLQEDIKECKNKKEYYMEEIKCCERLLGFLKEAETKSLYDFIDTLNTHASIYIEDFFPDEDIRVQLVTNKELKSGKDKLGLFFDVSYKTLKGDLDFLSGGQKDRINLAFTLAFSEIISNRILLLDECISSLDYETSNTVIETLKEKYKGKLVLVVSHQVNTGIFDEIITID